MACLTEKLTADAPASIYLKGMLGAALSAVGTRAEADAVLSDAAARSARVYGSADPVTKFIEDERAALTRRDAEAAR